MKAFNDFYKDYAKEKEHPIDRNSLDPAVWEFPDNNLPLLHPMIKTQILQDVQYINKIINVVEFYMVNKILTNEYTASTKIDVLTIGSIVVFDLFLFYDKHKIPGNYYLNK